MRGRRSLVAASLTAVLSGLLALGAVAESGDPIGGPESGIPSDTLWKIVSTCVNRNELTAGAPVCECKAFARSCCGDPATPNDAVVWAKTAQFVAIRDLKMC